jgi:formamidopyrimidine-DNA glycosylase
MPELPEVETVRRTLAPIVGCTIALIEVREPRLRRRVTAELTGRAIGRKVSGLERRGKYLLMHLSGGDAVLAHLGMSGTFTIVPASASAEPHDHVRFVFAGGAALVFNDPRRFGLIMAGRPEDFEELAHMGPDPLSDDFSPALLRELTRGRRRPVKNLLMDQRLLAGIGNIYANEILFEAGVRPSRQARKLRLAEVELLHAATRRVLAEAIESGGSSISDYRDGSGRAGYFQLRFRVYDRGGMPCLKCETKVRRVVHAGRSSFYCPKCQR